MEVFSLESNSKTEVLVIQTAKENQLKLTKRWTTEANLASKGRGADSSGRNRSRQQAMSCSSYFEEKGYFIKQNSTKLTENAKKLSEEEMHLLEVDIFKPLDFYELFFNRMKDKDRKICSKTPSFNRTFVIRF